MRGINELWKEFDEKGLTLGPEGITDLQRHIEHDEDPFDAVSTTQIMISVTVDPEWFKQELVHIMAKHLENEHSGVRDFVLGAVIGIFKDARYGEQALTLARFDHDEYVRLAALSGLGGIINKVDPKLAGKMAMHLYSVLTNPDENQFGYADRGASKDSILDSMGIHRPDWGTVNFKDVWKEFLKKYNLPEKEVVRVGRGW